MRLTSKSAPAITIISFFNFNFFVGVSRPFYWKVVKNIGSAAAKGSCVDKDRACKTLF